MNKVILAYLSHQIYTNSTRKNYQNGMLSCFSFDALTFISCSKLVKTKTFQGVI